MARAIHTRWKIKGTLMAETPIHVGGIGSDADSDLALALNGCGNYYIPGTSLAGALRGWMGQWLDDDAKVKELWGDHEHEQRGASFIVIEDADIQLNAGQTIEIREGVGIDRHTGAAGAGADGFKYSRAILPKGITLPLTVTLDCQSQDEPTDVWRLLQALEHGDIRLGAAKTRGLGRVRLDQIAIHRQTLNNADGLFEALLNQGQPQQWNDLKPTDYQSPAQLSIEMAWTPRDPVMVKAEGDGIAIDMLPLVSQVGADVRFVIPGSSIKGVLRAHAERIVRTVHNSSTKEPFLEQVQLDLVNELFGSAEKRSRKSESNKAQSQGQMGVLCVDDCYAKLSMAPDHWSAVENAKKEETEEFREFKTVLKTALNGKENPFRTLQPAMHVAVDRWTGGAAKGMLYSVLEPIGIEWGAIGIQMDIARLRKIEARNQQDNPQSPDLVKPTLALLLLVLRDFANRKIPIGYGTNRGMGTVEVSEMTLTCSQIDELKGIEGDHTVTDVPIREDLLGDLLHQPLLEQLTQAWVQWIDASSKEAARQ